MRKFVFSIPSIGLYEVIRANSEQEARAILSAGPFYRFSKQAFLISESEPCYRASD